MTMTTRENRPEHWGPMAPIDLLARLASEDVRVRAACKGAYHPTQAYYIAWEALEEQLSKGKPLNPSRLPLNARYAVNELQLRHRH